MSSNWKSPIIAFLDQSSIVINTIPIRISENMDEAQQAFINPKTHFVNLFCKGENMYNDRTTENCSYYYADSKNNYLYNIENLQPISYTKEFNSMPVSSSKAFYNARRKFSLEEDTQLNRLIELHGPKNWDKIALSMPGRTGRQCRDRFNNYLKPSLTNGPWSIDEDNLLKQKVKEIGKHWNIIAKFFNGRSSNNIKNRWYTYFCEEKKGQITEISNPKYDNQLFEYQSSENSENESQKNNSNNELNHEIDISVDSFAKCSNNSITKINENEFKNESSSDSLDDLEKNQDIIENPIKIKSEKRILFPQLCPPECQLYLSLNCLY
ncbi:hypothetical protein M9Y10_037166 [Tritrichomonas musculus]|uniref:Myb-like DNA-binding domain containing protein n=1 Tax=Tritrichomonas musculus TaxID=1915356 RepID=A0ABR2GT48_9EUKA